MDKEVEPTIGRLVADASRDISTLLHSEIALAKSEVKVSVKAGGIGAGLLAVAAFFGLLIIILVSIAAAFFLTMTGMHAAWAFLIVTGFYVVVAAILILLGIRLLKKIRAPEKTISTAKSLPSAFKGNPNSSRQRG